MQAPRRTWGGKKIWWMIEMNRMKISRNGAIGLALLAGMVIMATGCDREPEDESNGHGADTSHAGTDTSHAGADTVPSGADTAATWNISPTAAGPIRIGMSAPEAGAALRVETGTATADSCYFIGPKGDPQGVRFMITSGRVARVDVESTTIPTVEGARVGDSEERIMEIYRGHVQSMPHKYADGHYLIVTPGDPNQRIIFETDGRKVTRYRAGSLPEVEWVEGCS